MELPRRDRGDELLPAGELADIRRRLRSIAGQHDLTSVIACAFDHRTRMLPFIVADMLMVPAGVRAVGSAMVESGFEKTRIVLKQWNRHFKPSRMQIDGRLPDLFMISTMQLHWASCREMIKDILRIEPARRPLVIVGGPKAIYEPWDVFNPDPADPWSADLAVTGEAYVLLQMLEVVLAERGAGDSVRNAFLRARDGGMLDDVLGLVYARGAEGAVADELVDTGIQRLAGDLDSQAHPVEGYRLLERRSRKETLASEPLPANRIRKVSPLGSLVMTIGCKFSCQYCPIPAYNQRQYRLKSGERIADEIRRLSQTYGLRNFFGADDNFFNDHERTLEIAETLAAAKIDGAPLRHRARIFTEVTVHDTMKMAEHLPLIRKAAIRALWVGVEDMSGALVKKGQTANETMQAFQLLKKLGICPMPMMMHHDDQKLLTRKDSSGLLNQVRFLRKAGAASLQVLMITPSPGSKVYDETYSSGMVYDRVGNRRVDEYMIDGNYVIASHHPKPWRKQFNILAAYMYFYNPLAFLAKILTLNTRLKNAYIAMQIYGMYGLTQTIRRTFTWPFRLMLCKIKRRTKLPTSGIPMRNVEGERAAHALDGTPMPGGRYVSDEQNVAVTQPNS